MGALFNKYLDKLTVIEKISEKLKSLNLIANFRDKNWWVLNKNAETLITYVAINQWEGKSATSSHYLEIFYEPCGSIKQKRIFIPLFASKISTHLKKIYECDLSELKETRKKKVKEEVEEVESETSQVVENLETKNENEKSIINEVNL